MVKAKGTRRNIYNSMGKRKANGQMVKYNPLGCIFTHRVAHIVAGSQNRFYPLWANPILTIFAHCLPHCGQWKNNCGHAVRCHRR